MPMPVAIVIVGMTIYGGSLLVKETVKGVKKVGHAIVHVFKHPEPKTDSK